MMTPSLLMITKLSLSLALICLMVQDNVFDDATVLVDDPEAVVGLGGPTDTLVNP